MWTNELLIKKILFILAVGCLFSAGFLGSMSENKVYWETGSQYDLAGFNVFRNEGDNNSDVKLNEFLIAIQGNRNSGYSYQFIDRDIRFWKRYNYVIEAVKLDGTSESVEQISVGPNLWVTGFFLISIFSGVMLSMIVLLRRKHEMHKNGGGL